MGHSKKHKKNAEHHNNKRGKNNKQGKNKKKDSIADVIVHNGRVPGIEVKVMPDKPGSAKSSMITLFNGADKKGKSSALSWVVLIGAIGVILYVLDD